MTSKIEQLELLKAMAEGKPYYHMEVLSYNEALRNCAPLLLEIVKSARKQDEHQQKYARYDMDLAQKVYEALQKFEGA